MTTHSHLRSMSPTEYLRRYYPTDAAMLARDICPECAYHVNNCRCDEDQ